MAADGAGRLPGGGIVDDVFGGLNPGQSLNGPLFLGLTSGG